MIRYIVDWLRLWFVGLYERFTDRWETEYDELNRPKRVVRGIDGERYRRPR